jgi:hypothetical protein
LLSVLTHAVWYGCRFVTWLRVLGRGRHRARDRIRACVQSDIRAWPSGQGRVLRTLLRRHRQCAFSARLPQRGNAHRGKGRSERALAGDVPIDAIAPGMGAAPARLTQLSRTSVGASSRASTGAQCLDRSMRTIHTSPRCSKRDQESTGAFRSRCESTTTTCRRQATTCIGLKSSSLNMAPTSKCALSTRPLWRDLDPTWDRITDASSSAIRSRSINRRSRSSYRFRESAGRWDSPDHHGTSDDRQCAAPPCGLVRDRCFDDGSSRRAGTTFDGPTRHPSEGNARATGFPPAPTLLRLGLVARAQVVGMWRS